MGGEFKEVQSVDWARSWTIYILHRVEHRHGLCLALECWCQQSLQSAEVMDEKTEDNNPGKCLKCTGGFCDGE